MVSFFRFEVFAPIFGSEMFVSKWLYRFSPWPPPTKLGGKMRFETFVSQAWVRNFRFEIWVSKLLFCILRFECWGPTFSFQNVGFEFFDSKCPFRFSFRIFGFELFVSKCGYRIFGVWDFGIEILASKFLFRILVSKVPLVWISSWFGICLVACFELLR